MNAQVFIDAVDISNYLVKIDRQYNYCQISQSFSLQITSDYTTAIDTYAPVVIYEEGVKVLTGFVSSVTKEATTGLVTIEGGDVFKKASDYFVDTEITTTAGQKTQELVAHFLSLAGLTATFTSGEGEYVAEDTVLGLAYVSEIIVDLIQQAGWYGHVDPDGNIFFGKLEPSPSGKVLAEKVNLLDMQTAISYEKARNIAHVHGGVELTLDGFKGIFAKTSVNLPYLPTDQIVVAGNPLISNYASAKKFANQLIAELAQPEFVKKARIIGDPEIHVATYVYVQSDLYVGHALVTSITTSFDESGYLMDITLDNFCPRIVGHIVGQNELYAGTDGAGVWAWNIYAEGWADISNGMTDLHVIDLSVDKGLLAASTPTGVFVKINNQPWELQTLPTPTASGFVLASGEFTYPAVYANSYERQVNAIVNYSGGATSYSWLYTGVIDPALNIEWEQASINDLVTDPELQGSGFIYGTDMEGSYGNKNIVVESFELGDGNSVISNVTQDELADWRYRSNIYLGFADFYASNFTFEPKGYATNESLVYQDTFQSPGVDTSYIQFFEGESAYALAVHYDTETLLYNIYLDRFNARTGQYEDSVFLYQYGALAPSSISGTNGTVTAGVYTFIFLPSGKVYIRDLQPSLSGFTVGLGNWRTGTPITESFTIPSADSISFSEDHITTVTITQLFGSLGYDISSRRYDNETGVLLETLTLDFNSEDFDHVEPLPAGYQPLFVLVDSPTMHTDLNGNRYFAVRYRYYHYKPVGITPAVLVLKYTGNASFKIDSLGNQEVLYNNTQPISEGTIERLFYGLAGYTGQLEPLFFDKDGNIIRLNGTVFLSKTWQLPISLLGYDGSRLYYVIGPDESLMVVDGAGSARRYVLNGRPIRLTKNNIITDLGYIYSRATLKYITKAHFLDGYNAGYTYYHNPASKKTDIYKASVVYPTWVKRAYLLETHSGEYFDVLYSGYGFDEVNIDSYNMSAVYGPMGVHTSSDFFSTINRPTISNTYDAAAKIEKLYYTTETGIFSAVADSEGNNLENSIVATEIVARDCDGGEIFFSVGGEVKMSTNELSSYTDISTGLPGETVTVLRLGEST